VLLHARSFGASQSYTIRHGFRLGGAGPGSRDRHGQVSLLTLLVAEMLYSATSISVALGYYPYNLLALLSSS
jgi:hypothetical protein